MTTRSQPKLSVVKNTDEDNLREAKIRSSDRDVTEAIEGFLEPLVQISLEFKLDYRVIERAMARKFVELYKEDNPNATQANIVEGTGVKLAAVKEGGKSKGRSKLIVSKEGAVLEGWRQRIKEVNAQAEKVGIVDESKKEEMGFTREIFVRGNGNTFQQLVRKTVDAGAGYTAILESLIQSGSVEEVPNSRPRRVRMVKSHFRVASTNKVQSFKYSADAMRNFGLTLINNARVDDSGYNDDKVKSVNNPVSAIGADNKADLEGLMGHYMPIASLEYEPYDQEEDDPRQMTQMQIVEDVPRPLLPDYLMSSKMLIRHLRAMVRIFTRQWENKIAEAKSSDPKVAAAPTVKAGIGQYTFCEEADGRKHYDY